MYVHCYNVVSISLHTPLLLLLISNLLQEGVGFAVQVTQGAFQHPLLIHNCISLCLESGGISHSLAKTLLNYLFLSRPFLLIPLNTQYKVSLILCRTF